jgi:hypothetical protein
MQQILSARDNSSNVVALGGELSKADKQEQELYSMISKLTNTKHKRNGK